MMMLTRSLYLLLSIITVTSFVPHPHLSSRTLSIQEPLRSSDWGDFAALDDDDVEIRVDRTVYAKEEDPQELKAQIGSSRPTPTIEYDAEPIFVPQGKSCENFVFDLRVKHQCMPHHVFRNNHSSLIRSAQTNIHTYIHACMQQKQTYVRS
jgi:hypothetical protein